MGLPKKSKRYLNEINVFVKSKLFIQCPNSTTLTINFKKTYHITPVQKTIYPRQPFYVIKIAPSPTKIIISRIVNINKNIRIVCLQSLQTIHNYQNYAYKVVYPSVYYKKNYTYQLYMRAQFSSI